MPAWITHIVTANKVLKKIKIEDENSFLVGNILPDINNAHFVKDVKNVLSHQTTHFTSLKDLKEINFNYYNIVRFKEEYKNNLNNSLVLGYLTHILTDSYWNEIAYNEHYIYDENKNLKAVKLFNGNIKNCDKHTATKMKQLDFNKFSDYILSVNKDIHIPNYTENLVKDANIIKENRIDCNDINKAIECLKNMINNSMVDEEYNYQLFTREELEKKFNKSIDSIISDIENFI